jgi:uncharacterized membrane protein
MNTRLKRVLYWTPRVLCILFAMFLSVFALDVFNQGLGFWQTIGELLLHLVPNFIVLGVLAMSWRREWVGAVLFIALAVFYVVWAWGRRLHWSVYPLIAGPLVLMSVLFLLNWRYRDQLRER